MTLQCLSADGNDSIIVDWFEINYRRDYVAADNTLKFSPDSGSRYQIDGFDNSNLVAYDISDFRLTGMNGLDFLKLATVTHPDAIRFLITAYRDDYIFSDALRTGIDEFIEKPFAVKALVNLLALAFKRQTRKQTAAGI